MNLALQRLHNQRIAGGSFEKPADVVRWLGSVQAQDYLGALWAVGLRLRSSTEKDVEKALADRTVVRTWPLRGTLHFVAAEDARWMLELLTPRILSANARRLKQQYGLDTATISRGRKALVRALRDGRQLPRNAMYQVLEAAGLPAAGQRGLHILWWLAQEGLLCFGPRQGKQQTFVLMDEWIPGGKRLERAEALARLAHRYFTGHGPATVQDFIWWSGLAPVDATEALGMARRDLLHEAIEGKTYWFSSSLPTVEKAIATAHLLPAYDEYTVGYKDRSAVLKPRDAERPDSGKGIFNPVMVLGGKIVGTWKRTLKKDAAEITLSPFSPLTKTGEKAFTQANSRYGAFLELPAGG